MVTTLGEFLDVGQLHRIAGNQQGTALVGKAVTDGGLYRRVVHRQCLHFQPPAFIYQGQLAQCRLGKGHGCQAGRAHRGDKIPVVFMAVDEILCIGCVEAVHDPLHAFGAINRQWRGVVPTRPAQSAQLTQAIDMVRVKVREKYALDGARLVAHASEVAGSICARVHHEQLLTGNHRDAGAGRVGCGQGATGATQGEVKSILQLRDHIRAHAGFQSPLHDPCCDRRSLAVGDCDDHGQNTRHCEEFFHPYALPAPGRFA